MSEISPTVVSDEEQLARFVMTRRWVRDDGTIRQDAFIPPPDLKLSVTRHARLSADDLWSRGGSVAKSQEKPLLGRADLAAKDVRKESLEVVRFPVKGNPEHAHILNWPTDKPAQKSRAQQLSRAATFTKAPATGVG